MSLKLINNIEGILFDFDGVLFDTEPLWFKASINTLKKLKINYNKKIYYKHTIGVESNIVFQKLLNKKIYDSKIKEINKVYAKELKKIFSKKIKPVPHLINFLKNSNIPRGIVSNSNKSYINDLLHRSNLNIYFNKKYIVSCRNYLKPKPDGYQKGMQLLKINPNKILVIEDSETGIKAAKKAKIKNIIRYTHNNLNLNKNLRYKDIKNFKSFKNLLRSNLCNI